MKKRVVSLLMAGVMTMGLLTGCGNDASNDTSKAPSEGQANAGTEKESKEEEVTPSDDIVELNFYLSAGAINDQDRIMDKANEIIEKEIGAHLNIISLADYNTMQLMIDTGDPWDLCFTSNWMGDYFGNAQKGAYADLTELLPQLAPETYTRIPASLWEGMKVNGKIYGSVNYQQWGSSKSLGLRFRKDIAEEVKFDWQSLKGMDIMEALPKIEKEYLEPAMAAHPDMIGWEAAKGSNLYEQGQAAQFLNAEYVGDSVKGSVGWINYDEPTKVYNQYADETFMEYCKLMRSWYEKGYIASDAATVEDTSADRASGRYLCEVALGRPDSIDFPKDIAMSMTTIDSAPAVEVSLTDLLMPAAAAPTAAVAVNAYSENIEKCVELIELLNTNDDLYKLITLGEEGVDFEYDASGEWTPIEGKYSFNWSDYQLGQSYDPEFNRAAYAQNENGELQKQSQAIVHKGDQTATASPLSGFVFDPEPVKTEIANVTAVVSEMLYPLVTGSVDPEERVPEFVERLETAGAGTIVEEKQRQLDAWLATK